MSPAKTVSAHSPAPYRPRDPLHHAELYVAKTDDLRGMELIAEVGPAMRDDEALANACLFEVAGELLDAARDLVALYGDFQPGEAYADPPELAPSLRLLERRLYHHRRAWVLVDP